MGNTEAISMDERNQNDFLLEDNYDRNSSQQLVHQHLSPPNVFYLPTNQNETSASATSIPSDSTFVGQEEGKEQQEADLFTVLLNPAKYDPLSTQKEVFLQQIENLAFNSPQLLENNSLFEERTLVEDNRLAREKALEIKEARDKEREEKRELLKTSPYLQMVLSSDIQPNWEELVMSWDLDCLKKLAKRPVPQNPVSIDWKCGNCQKKLAFLERLEYQNCSKCGILVHSKCCFLVPSISELDLTEEGSSYPVCFSCKNSQPSSPLNSSAPSFSVINNYDNNNINYNSNFAANEGRDASANNYGGNHYGISGSSNNVTHYQNPYLNTARNSNFSLETSAYPINSSFTDQYPTQVASNYQILHQNSLYSPQYSQSFVSSDPFSNSNY